MMYWDNVTLWKRTDKGLPGPEAVDRVRSVNFGTVTIKESLPQEVRYLKYLETFQVYGNANTMLLSIDLENHICELEYLKNLVMVWCHYLKISTDWEIHWKAWI